MKKYFSKITSCFDTRADFNSVLYSRCILYLVLLLSLINLFYLIQIQDAQTVMVFLLSGFVASFFIKNMIIIISFAILISLIYHYWPLIKTGTLPHITITYSENFENGEEEEKEHEDEQEETFKYQYQGQIDPNSNTEKEPEPELEPEQNEDPEKENDEKKDRFRDAENDDTKSTKSSKKVTEIRKDMTNYFEIQQKLLDLFEQAEPLQKQAEAYKEKFQNK